MIRTEPEAVMSPTRLLIAPAATGKTAYAVDYARAKAHALQASVRVCVPGSAQAQAWRKRLAEGDGAIGVSVLTFAGLYAEVLQLARETYTGLIDPVQFRLLRSIASAAPLVHYAPLARSPGFIQVLQDLIGELKSARIQPQAFTAAVHRMGAESRLGAEPRLAELAVIYNLYQERLQQQDWADTEGMAWLTVEALEQRAPLVGRDWPLLIVDGFDNFTEVQLALLQILSSRVGELLITLTGPADDQDRSQAQARFVRTRRALQQRLGVEAQPLPQRDSRHAPALRHLEASLYVVGAPAVDGAGAVQLIEATDRASEVREALRWLKQRLAIDGMRAGEVALLARSITPYRPFILETAAEFGLPLHLLHGLPLNANPAVRALLDLLQLVLPISTANPEPALPHRLLIEAWRSPYFDWSAQAQLRAGMPLEIGIQPGDADRLDAVARWGQVIGGWSQWQEALTALAGRATDGDADAAEDADAGQPPGPAAAADLRGKLERFVTRLTPPAEFGVSGGTRAYVRWLESLIGPDPQARQRDADDEPSALQMVRCIHAGPPGIAELDLAALRCFKDILRGLVWAEEAVPGADQATFAQFMQDLQGAIQAASYLPPTYQEPPSTAQKQADPLRPAQGDRPVSEREGILVADVIQARGVAFRAVAVLGLGEGEFPATLGEDPFLRDAARKQLREQFSLALNPSTESAESEFFYETVTRPRERLLLTRSRLADNGALWPASHFWDEVRRCVTVTPQTISSQRVLEPAETASWPELMESVAARPGDAGLLAWVEERQTPQLRALETAADILVQRANERPSHFDGDLGALAGALAAKFDAKHVWSASRLEIYRACPFRFFVGSVLKAEPRPQPTEGLDVAQRGTIYHRLLEAVYQHPDLSDPTDALQLQAILAQVAGPILDDAPQREGFRATAWWTHTRAEIARDIATTLQGLADLSPEYHPYRFEARFLDKPLRLKQGAETLLLRGMIDRVDRADDGKLRIIDYKSGGASDYTKAAVLAGEKLQLPLYALAARDALKLGQPAEGFYWSVSKAAPSSFSLGKFDGGPEEALKLAQQYAWEAVHGVRAGEFKPLTPDGGCPDYCPAAGFCWHYQPRQGG